MTVTSAAIALPPPGQPADRGASSLGLVMVVGALTVGLAIATRIAEEVLAGAAGGAAAVVLAVSAIRLVAHAVAGHQLARGRPARGAALAYVAIAVAHAVAVGWWLGPVAAAAALAWPAVVAAAVATGGRARGGGGGEHAAAAVVLGAIGLWVIAALAGFVAEGGVETGVAATLRHAVPSIAGMFAVIAAWSGLDPRAPTMQVFDLGIDRALTVAGLCAGVAMLFNVIRVAAYGRVELATIPLILAVGVVVPVVIRTHAQRGELDPGVALGAARLTLAWLLAGHGLLAGVLDVATGAVWRGAAVGVAELVAAVALCGGRRSGQLVAGVALAGAVAAVGAGWVDAGRDPAELPWSSLVLPVVFVALVRRQITATTATATARLRRGSGG
jgi:hypothetical protein